MAIGAKEELFSFSEILEQAVRIQERRFIVKKFHEKTRKAVEFYTKKSEEEMTKFP